MIEFGWEGQDDCPTAQAEALQVLSVWQYDPEEQDERSSCWKFMSKYKSKIAKMQFYITNPSHFRAPFETRTRKLMVPDEATA